MRAFVFLALVSAAACAAAPGLDSDGAKDDKKKSDSPTKINSDGGSSSGDRPSKGDGQEDEEPSTSTTSIELSWTSLGSYLYSLDVKTANGEWIGPCLDASIIGSSTSATFKGVCTSAAGQTVPSPAAYRLYYSRSNADVQHWQDYVEVPASASSKVVFNLPTASPTKVDLTWNKKSETADYSLDVFLINGEKVRPCYNSDALGKSTALSFDGACTAGPSYRRVDLKDVSDFVICSAENGNWQAAVCTGIPYSGYGSSRAIPN